MGAINPIERIIFYDGVCNLCSASVQFVIKRDRKKKFRFASLQSSFATSVLRDYEIENSLKTIVLLKNGKIYFQSDAALEVMGQLDGLWPLLRGLKIIPRFVRDRVYNFIARHRYRWFGKTDVCWVPSPDLSPRFVD